MQQNEGRMRAKERDADRTGNMTGTKQEIRRQVLRLRDALSQEERKRGAVLLTERILGHQWFYGSDRLLAFASHGSEIDTSAIIQEALRLGKQVYLPKVCGKCGEPEGGMEFYQIRSLGELQEGYRGIKEPEGVTARYCYSPETAGRSLLLMPGVAFDRCGNRVGYGKGFYDRYLEGKEALQMRSVAVGFCCQMVEEIPAQGTDIRPCQVICV